MILDEFRVLDEFPARFGTERSKHLFRRNRGLVQNKHVEQESQIKTLQAQINESNDKLLNLINRVSQDSQKIREIEDRHKDALKHKQDQLEKIFLKHRKALVG